MEQLLYRAEEISRLLNIGRSKAYMLMASGELPVVRIGRSVRVPARALERWIDSQSGSTEWWAAYRAEADARVAERAAKRDDTDADGNDAEDNADGDDDAEAA